MNELKDICEILGLDPQFGDDPGRLRDEIFKQLLSLGILVGGHEKPTPVAFGDRPWVQELLARDEEAKREFEGMAGALSKPVKWLDEEGSEMDRV